MAYTIFNGVRAVFVLLVLPVFVRSRQQLGTALRNATFITLIACPWDYFAISLGAWGYTGPGYAFGPKQGRLGDRG